MPRLTRNPMTTAAAGRQRDDATVAMDSLRRLVRALRVASAASERAHQVSAAQLFVLRQIAAHPGLSLKALARRTLTGQSAISEAVSRLVSRGLVARHEGREDRRRVELTLTPEGIRALADAPESLPERLVAGFRTLPVAEQRALGQGLERWLAASGLADVPATMFFEPIAGEPAQPIAAPLTEDGHEDRTT